MCVVVSSRGMFESRDSCFSYDDTFQFQVVTVKGHGVLVTLMMLSR